MLEMMKHFMLIFRRQQNLHFPDDRCFEKPSG
jgi:hypothetical protein